MMADPIDDAIAQAQRDAFKAVPATAAATVTPIRSSLASVPTGPVCIPAEDFLRDTEAPQWVIAGLMQSNYVYSLTAPTNHGKTAVSLVMALAVAAGKPFAGLDTTLGRVLILCGENQDGFRLRMLATMEAMGVTMTELRRRLFVMPQAAGLAFLLEQIKKDAEGIGDLTLVLVDTSVAFFTGDDENHNQQAYSHARDLRELSMLPGKPAVLVNCHPSSSAGKDHSRESCVPRGGSAFLNEIDTNLTVWSEGDTAELHWMRKKRGPDFSPILFEYRAVNIDQHGTTVPTVVAHHIDEEREKHLRSRKKEAECRLMFVMYQNPTGTLRDWAHEAGFVIRSGKMAGMPHLSFTARTLERMKEYKLAERSRRDGWILTAKGKEEAKDIR